MLYSYSFLYPFSVRYPHLARLTCTFPGIFRFRKATARVSTPHPSRPRLYYDDGSGSPGPFIVEAGADVMEGGDPCGRLRTSLRACFLESIPKVSGREVSPEKKARSGVISGVAGRMLPRCISLRMLLT